MIYEILNRIKQNIVTPGLTLAAFFCAAVPHDAAAQQMPEGKAAATQAENSYSVIPGPRTEPPKTDPALPTSPTTPPPLTEEQKQAAQDEMERVNEQKEVSAQAGGEEDIQSDLAEMIAVLEEEQNAEERRKAARQLQRIAVGMDMMPPVVEKLLTDLDLTVRYHAAIAIWLTSNSRGKELALSHLEQALFYDDPDVRAGAASALGGLLPPKTNWPFIVEALRKHREEIVMALVKATRDKEVKVRFAALGALGNIPDFQSTPARQAIFNLTADPDDRVRASAIRLLGITLRGDSALTPILLQTLEQKANFVSFAALEALDAHRDIQRDPNAPKVQTMLSEMVLAWRNLPYEPAMYDDPALMDTANLTRMAARVLHKFENQQAQNTLKEAVPIYTGLLTTDHEKLRMYGAIVLAGIGPVDPSVVTSLSDALDKDYYENVRAAAAESLSNINPLPEKAALVLARKARDDSWPEVRLVAIEGLGLIGRQQPTLALSALQSIAEKGPQNLVAPERAEELRVAAIHSLGMLGQNGYSAMPLLEKLSQDKSAIIKQAAAESIQAIKTGKTEQKTLSLDTLPGLK